MAALQTSAGVQRMIHSTCLQWYNDLERRRSTSSTVLRFCGSALLLVRIIRHARGGAAAWKWSQSSPSGEARE